MKKASKVVGDRIWTLTYTNNADGTIDIQNFDNEDGDGYMFFEQLERLEEVHETDGRVVDAVTINGHRVEVRNKQNVFTYRQPL
jgi:hypothetical protein